MSKMPRPSLSDVLPAKGAAARMEPLPQMTDDAAAMPVVSQASPEPVVRQTAAGEGRGKPSRIVRIPLTVKVSETVYKRLREASFREEMDKQDLVDQALDALLTKMGY